MLMSVDAHDHGRASFVGAHRLWARIGRRRASCVGAYGLWACILHGHVWVVGVYGLWARMGRGQGRCWPWALVCMGEGLSCPWALVIRGGRSLSSMGGALSSAGWSSVGGGEGGRCGPWALSLGVVCGRWVLFGALGIVCGRWASFVGAGSL